MNPEFNKDFYLTHLASYHRLFYAVLQLGDPVFTKDISTAAVGWNEKSGKITFMINPDFFFKLGLREQLFILCHEALHIILEHFQRSTDYNLDDNISNVAQDIVINELLVRLFGFPQQSLDFGFTLCFVDTVFSAEQIRKFNITKEQNSEFYYNLLIENKPDPSLSSLDIHLTPEEEGEVSIVIDGERIGKIPDEILNDFNDRVGQDLNIDELNEIMDRMSDYYGTGNDHNSYNVELTERQKRPWEKIVRRKIASLVQKKERNQDSFRFRPRRATTLDPNIYLPAQELLEYTENDKFNAFFFIDASRSCQKYLTRFFNLIKSVPKDKFNIHLYSFDTNVYELDPDKPVVIGGGATAWQPLEDLIQVKIRTEPKLRKKHPDLVFVLTDGIASKFSPEKPEHWYFLLTEDYTKNLPAKSNIIRLYDFEKGKPQVTSKNLQIY